MGRTTKVPVEVARRNPVKQILAFDISYDSVGKKKATDDTNGDVAVVPNGDLANGDGNDIVDAMNRRPKVPINEQFPKGDYPIGETTEYRIAQDE
jgi:hypothetical protein